MKDKQSSDPMISIARVTVCTPKGSCKRGCKEVREALLEEISKRKLKIVVGNAKAGCDGNCETGPVLGFPDRLFFYLGVAPADVPLQNITPYLVLLGLILLVPTIGMLTTARRRRNPHEPETYIRK